MSKYSEKVKGRQHDRLPSAREMQESDLPATKITPNVSGGWTHFCAGLMVKKVEGVWCAAGVTDERFPSEVKLPGGTNKHSLWETKWQTLCRELGEECLVELDPRTCCQQVYFSIDESRCHTKYFFYVRNWQGEWRTGSFKDSDGQQVTAKQLPLAEFWRRCFSGHKEGFQKAIQWIVREKLHTEPDFAAQARGAGIIVS